MPSQSLAMTQLFPVKFSKEEASIQITKGENRLPYTRSGLIDLNLLTTCSTVSKKETEPI